MTAGFPYALELTAWIDSKELELDTAFPSRGSALELVRIANEWVAASPDSPESRYIGSIAADLAEKISAVNLRIRREWRERIGNASFRGRAVREALDRYTAYRPDSPSRAHYGPDGLDGLIDCILGIEPNEVHLQRAETEFVHYEPVPARVILELIDRVPVDDARVFYDMGSGLGRVNVLVALLATCPSKGVEIDRRLVSRAKASVGALGLGERITFICEDATTVEISDGTVFFLFSPFHGRSLDAFLGRLEDRRERVSICSYGNSTIHFAGVPWLKARDTPHIDPFKLAVFSNR